MLSLANSAAIDRLVTIAAPLLPLYQVRPGRGRTPAVDAIVTNTPLQALVTLNDPVYQEANRALARRMLRPADVQDVLADAFFQAWREAPRFAFKPLPWSDLIEIPVTTALFAGRRLAAGGGGFFRVLPYGFSRWAIRQVNRADGRPAVFYFHPWEIDPDQPRVSAAPLKSKLRHYTNLDGMAGKLRQLVGEFQWGRMDVLAAGELRSAMALAA